jgi:hypothetical protein
MLQALSILSTDYLLHQAAHTALLPDHSLVFGPLELLEATCQLAHGRNA